MTTHKLAARAPVVTVVIKRNVRSEGKARDMACVKNF